MKVGNKVLGLAIGSKSIQVAEVVAKGDRHAVTHCAEFVFPEGLTMSQPDRMGQALRKFLKEHQIHTKDTVIGLPAKRLVTRRKEVPPASLAVAASTLRLQAEGEFSSELDNLVMDYAGQTSTAESTTVLLIATKKVEVDECDLMANAAGLRVVGVTSTTAALGRATSRLPGGDGLVLSLGTHGAELVIQHGNDPAHLKHLNVVGGADSYNALAGEIRRTMAAIPRNGTPMTLALWNCSTTDSPRSMLEQRLSMPVTTPEVSSLAMTETPNTEGYAPAVALALAAMEPAGLPIDFLHSRMAPPKPPAISNQKKLLIAAGVLVAAITAFAYVDLSRRQTQVNNLLKQVASPSHVAATKEAKLRSERIKFIDEWLPKGPINLEVLRDLTQLFPQQGGTIWATSLGSTRDAWELDGKASNQTYPTNLVQAMQQAPASERFRNPSLTNIQYEPATGLWSFRLQFTYVPRSNMVSPMASQSGPASRATNRGNTGRTNTTRVSQTSRSTTSATTRSGN